MPGKSGNSCARTFCISFLFVNQPVTKYVQCRNSEKNVELFYILFFVVEIFLSDGLYIDFYFVSKISGTLSIDVG